VNGERVAWIIEILDQVGNVEMAELVKEYWEDVGVEISIKPTLGELMGQRATTNKIAMNTWAGDKATDVYFLSGDIRQYAPISTPGQEMYFGVEWHRWFITDGKEGEEPPEEVKKLYEWRDRMMITMDEEERIQLGKKILSSQAENIWQLTVVGLVPKPVILNGNLRNVPEEHLFGCDYAFVRDTCPEQYFFEQE
jgi:peptide/nickel transport system substrate-binding protein